MQLTLVTGNKHKAEEWRRMMPADFKLTSHAVDLDELQSLDADAVIEHKVRQAYAQLGVPVVVEDVMSGLDELKGLPGPFIKFFVDQLGPDALHKMHKGSNKATAICTIGYFDGSHLIIARGVVHGQAVEPRGDTSFGFDCSFLPNGQDQTFGQMPRGLKDNVSHRALAIQDLVHQLRAL